MADIFLPAEVRVDFRGSLRTPQVASQPTTPRASDLDLHTAASPRAALLVDAGQPLAHERLAVIEVDTGDTEHRARPAHHEHPSPSRLVEALRTAARSRS
jgi:hypothetical protein